jgi:hypothetical protein
MISGAKCDDFMSLSFVGWRFSRDESVDVNRFSRIAFFTSRVANKNWVSRLNTKGPSRHFATVLVQ